MSCAVLLQRLAEGFIQEFVILVDGIIQYMGLDVELRLESPFAELFSYI